MRSTIPTNLPSPPSGKAGFPWTLETTSAYSASDAATLPRISIVTPSFNQAQYLEETIRSVLLQGYPNLEYIVIDGGSTDGSVDIIRQYAPWLTYWVSEPDHGQADAINKGFRQSSAQIMNWLNSDDCLLPNALWHVAAHFHAVPTAQVVCGFRRNVLGHTPTRVVRVHLRPDKYTLSRICYIAQETTFWRREVWETVGELDASYRFALDFELWQRMLAAGYQFTLLPRFTGVFRLHPDSKGSRWWSVRTAELAQIYQRYLGTSKGEKELPFEINPWWWRRTILLRKLGRLGLLDHPKLARMCVSALSLQESEIPSKSNTAAWFLDYWSAFQ